MVNHDHEMHHDRRSGAEPTGTGANAHECKCASDPAARCDCPQMNANVTQAQQTLT